MNKFKITNFFILSSISLPIIWHFLFELMLRGSLTTGEEDVGLGIVYISGSLITASIILLTQMICVPINTYALVKKEDTRSKANIGITLLGGVLIIVSTLFLIEITFG